jgi:hypothetical protein
VNARSLKAQDAHLLVYFGIGDENGTPWKDSLCFQSDLRALFGGVVMKTLGFCPADLAEIPKRIDQSAIRHFPQLWESLVRLQIRADDVFNDLVGAVNDSW